jgi:hypothetical protein
VNALKEVEKNRDKNDPSSHAKESGQESGSGSCKQEEEQAQDVHTISPYPPSRREYCF